MAAKRPKKPEPISKHIVCSSCGLSWEAHGETPTLETCVDLLKAELAKPRQHFQYGGSASTTGWPLWTPQGGAN